MARNLSWHAFWNAELVKPYLGSIAVLYRSVKRNHELCLLAQFAIDAQVIFKESYSLSLGYCRGVGVDKICVIKCRQYPICTVASLEEPYIYLWPFSIGIHCMRCPYCNYQDSKVLDTSHDSHGTIRRRRECFRCKQRFSTYERPVISVPLITKQDGSREEFDRQKLERGIRIACAKRPVSATDIERLVGQIESELQRLGKPEVSSRVIGDMVIKALRELDLVAYIRYAIVYLKLDDLSAVRKEIDKLLNS